MIRLFRHEMLARWKAVIWWSIGLGAFGSMYIFVFPEAAEEMASIADMTIYLAMGIDLASFEGYIGSVIMLFLPLLLGIYAIVNGTRTLAGEEEDGTLELLLVHPVKRWEIVAAKAAALGIGLMLILVLAGLINAASLAAVKATFETDLTPLQLFPALISAWPIVMAIAMISLFLGAFTPTRRLASMIATVILVGSYLVENIAGMVGSLDAVKSFSLFTYFDTTATGLSEGAALSDVVVLIAVSAVFFVLAVVSFQRRDVSVGAWPWVRARIES